MKAGRGRGVGRGEALTPLEKIDVYRRASGDLLAWEWDSLSGGLSKERIGRGESFAYNAGGIVTCS